MKLWKISQNVNGGYDTYSDAVVAAETEEEARHMHPSGYYFWEDRRWTATRKDGTKYDEGNYGSWATPDQVKVDLLGEACEGISAGMICESFHAG